ncbi:hypothetical protein FQN54_003709 [Arachnomyces sp. PD_36]|nr:hypothetical protein FQN54_003709 [Arachnomyces sp. PD_36]
MSGSIAAATSWATPYLNQISPYLPENVYGKAAVVALGLTLAHTVGLVIYRLAISPLAGFPGPWLAAVTGWHEFYYDFFKHGKFVFEVERMHAKYGPIVRINPFELSIRDPEFYDQVYVAGSVRRTENYDTFARGIEFDGSHFLSTAHELHRKRRKPLEPFFSRLGITRLESQIGELVQKLVGRFEALKGTGTVVRLDHAFLAFSGDVISMLCVHDPRHLLDSPNFAPEWFDLLHSVIKSLPLFMGFPFLISIIRLIPESFLIWAHPRSQNFNNFKNMAEGHIVQAKNEKEQMGEKDTSSTGGRITVFRHLVNSDLPQEELSVERLSKEAQVLLGAGTVSTARTLDFICYYILADPSIRTRLQEELKDVTAGYPSKMPRWSELEQCQFMQAVIKEGLRLSYGIMHRLPRVSPDVPLQFKQWKIPAGVPVGMSSYFQQTDPRVYPEPFAFRPERWLSNVTQDMTRNFVPFSKGSRNCLGMNLAYAELNLVIAALFRPGGPAFDLWQTDESDIIQAHDYMIPLPKLDTKGVRVIFY